MTCAHCGAKLLLGDKFCSDCGARAGQLETPIRRWPRPPGVSERPAKRLPPLAKNRRLARRSAPPQYPMRSRVWALFFLTVGFLLLLLWLELR